MSLKVLIVEDEELYADKLEMLIDKLGYEHLKTVDNSQDALTLIQCIEPDLILMDIHIQGDRDGIELAALINEEQTIPIIFITSMADDLTFSRAGRANPVNFLLKPFNDLQLQRSIELTVAQLNKKADEKDTESSHLQKNETWENDFIFKNSFFIKFQQKLEKIDVSEILFIKSDGHYCQIFTIIKKYLVRISMANLINKLPSKLFIQTHRSHYININKIDAIDLSDSIIKIAEHEIPLSSRNKDSFLKKINYI